MTGYLKELISLVGEDWERGELYPFEEYRDSFGIPRLRKISPPPSPEWVFDTLRREILGYELDPESQTLGDRVMARIHAADCRLRGVGSFYYYVENYPKQEVREAGQKLLRLVSV